MTSERRLSRAIGFWPTVALVVGITIGSGIFRTPASVARLVPNAGVVLALWAFASMLVIPAAKKLHYLFYSPRLASERSRALAVSGGIALLALAITSVEAATPITIPYSSRDGRVLLPARVNGTGPLNFLLDTGYELIMLNPQHTQRLGLKPQRVDHQRAAEPRLERAYTRALAQLFDPRGKCRNRGNPLVRDLCRQPDRARMVSSDEERHPPAGSRRARRTVGTPPAGQLDSLAGIAAQHRARHGGLADQCVDPLRCLAEWEPQRVVLGRIAAGAGFPVTHAINTEADMAEGRRILREGHKVALLSFGARLGECLKAADELAALGLSTTVADARFANQQRIVLAAAAKRLNDAFQLVVAADHEEIADEVRSFGGTVIMTSPDCASGTDRVAEIARARPEIDVFVNVQGDEPLVAPGMIDEVPALCVAAAFASGVSENNLRILSNTPVYVAGFDRGVRPMGCWSTATTLSMSFMPSTRSCSNTLTLALLIVFSNVASRMPLINVDLPEPDLPTSATTSRASTCRSMPNATGSILAM